MICLKKENVYAKRKEKKEKKKKEKEKKKEYSTYIYNI